MRQRLDSDDRIAFSFGLFDPVSYDCAPCDRFANTGKFSIWDFRSEGERRTSNALDITLNGRANTLGLAYQFNAGVLAPPATRPASTARPTTWWAWAASMTWAWCRPIQI